MMVKYTARKQLAHAGGPMPTTEDRLATLDARFDTLMETLANQLNTMNERVNSLERTMSARMDDMRGWLMALTGLAGVQLTALIALNIVLSRLGR
jgi:hypothetical protein